MNYFEKMLISPTRSKWILSFGGWTVYGVASCILSQEMTSRAFVFRDFVYEMLFWYTIAAGTPAIFWLAERYPIERGRIVKRLLFHGCIALLYILVYSLIRTVFDAMYPAHPLGTDPTMPFKQNYFAILQSSIRIVHFDYWALLGIGHALNYYRQYREREKEATRLQVHASHLETQLALAELQALRMQLNPHFLFNTLHSISGLVREDNKHSAIRMIAGLGDLLRRTLGNAGTQEVSLKEELEFLENYLDIERIRFQDRLRIFMYVEPRAYVARVPYLILQPIVENAMRHGISRSVDASLLEIRVWLENDELKMQVRDDGPGISPGSRERIGLKNTRARLEGLYGQHQKFEIGNSESGGAVALIAIPFLRSEKAERNVV